MARRNNALLVPASALVRVIREWSLPLHLFSLLNHPSPTNDPSGLEPLLFPHRYTSKIMSLVLALGIPAQHPQLLAVSFPSLPQADLETIC